MAVTVQIINGSYVAISPGKPNRVLGPAATGGRSISTISATGLVTLTDGSHVQLNLPSGKGISTVSAGGLITFSDGSSQQLSLGSGTAGRGITSATQPSQGVLRLTFTDGDVQNFTLPASNTPGAAGRGIASVSPTGLLTFTDNATQQLTLPSGGSGPRGNYVSANPAASGPVLIVQGGAYVAANPNMLGNLTAQLYLKGTDGLYSNGLVPFTWPNGVTAGYRLVLQAQTAGSNILWLAPAAAIPSTLGTTDAAFVDLGTAGALQDTVILRPQPPYFDTSAVKTSELFLAATYANIAAFEAVYQKFGSFSALIYDEAGAPVSNRILEINDTTNTGGAYGYLRTSYPSGTASFPNGSAVATGKKGGNTGTLAAIMRFSGTTNANYTAIEARLSTSGQAIGLYSIVNGTATQIGSSVTKGTVSNDTFWSVQVACLDNRVMARAWLSSGAQPSTWDIDTTQTAVTAAGYAGFRTSIAYGRFSFFGVSRGDANAPVS